MKNFLFFFFLYVSWTVNAFQLYDTIYHPMYNNVQLIELRVYSQNRPNKGFISVQKSEQVLEVIPKYILRNDKGEELVKYNDFDNSLSVRKLKPLETTNVVTHWLKTKNTSGYIGFDDSGFNIVYPVYSCKPSDNNTCVDMKIGLLDTFGTLVLPIQFEYVQWIDSVFITQQNNLFSLYSHDFKLLLKDYQYIEYINTNKNHILLKNHNQYGLVNRSGKNLLSMEYQEIRTSKYMHGYYEYLHEGLWGFADFNFSRILEPFSPSPNLFQRDGYFQYYDENKQWTVIDSTGRIYLKSPIEMYQVLTPNRFLVTKYVREEGYQRSICDASGTVISDKIYYDIWRVGSNTLIAGYDASIHDASDLKKSSKWILLDFNGNIKLNKIYKSLLPLDDNYIKAWDNKGKLSVIDGEGNDILGYEIEDVYKYSDHLFKIKKDGKHEFLDFANPIYLSKSYDNLMCVRENRIAVEKDKSWGFLDGNSLKEITPIAFDQVICYQDGLAGIKSNNKWKIIDEKGKSINNEYYTSVEILKNGLVKVTNQDRSGILSRNGMYTVPMVYDEMRFIASNNGKTYIGVKKNNKYGIINEKNELIYDFLFETCAELSVHASIPQNRQAGFYAFLSITKRNTIEYYYLNFDPSKSEMKIQSNYTRGFKIVTKNCSSNSTGKCMGVVNWEGKEIIPSNYTFIKDLRYNTFEVRTQKGCGLMDTLGRMLIAPVYLYMYELGSDSTLIQVGRHQGPWGLYNRSGRQIADTIYGGFEKPIGPLIPFYANFNFRVVDDSWIQDEKRIGFMDYSGRIVIDPLYDRYYLEDPKKDEITLFKGDERVTINSKGQVLKGELVKPSMEVNTPSMNQPQKKKRKKRKHRIKWL